ncbi:MAG: hypothetical protein Ta2B_24210 [Termitinemataceae bacterium]|nr:MAG: hypothetical protein Ta2B_24210 [Termitinemataceae bacterium]
MIPETKNKIFIRASSCYIQMSLVAVILVLNCVSVFAQDKKDAQKVFVQYMDCVKKSDYASASKYILKEDLENFKNLLVPIFVKLLKTDDDPDVAALTDMLFGKYTKKPESIPPQTFFANFMNFVVATQEGFAEIMEQAEFEIGDIYFNENDPNLLIINYKINFTVYMFEEDAFEQLIYTNKKWFLKLKQDPNDFVDLLNQLQN